MEIKLSQNIMGRENNFDLIRFIAASLVILSHAFPLSGQNDGELLVRLSNGQWTLGGIAVAIFFVVSGLLIAQSYDRSKNLPVFLKSRFLRLYPGLIVMVLICTFILGPIITILPVKEYLVHPQSINYLKGITLFPVQYVLPGVFEFNAYKSAVNGSLWTIPFEILCYLVVALIGVSKLLNNKNFILFLLFVTLYFRLFGAAHLPTQIFLGIDLVTFVDLFVYFFIGVVFYVFREKISLNKWLAVISLFMLILGLVLGGFRELFIFFGSYLVIYVAYNKTLRCYNFARFGDFSYGMYIYAFPVQQTVTYLFGGQMSPFSNFLLAFPITLLLSIFSWHIIEKPSLKLKKKKAQVYVRSKSKTA